MKKIYLKVLLSFIKNINKDVLNNNPKRLIQIFNFPIALVIAAKIIWL
jgi:hypothetical protein